MAFNKVSHSRLAVKRESRDIKGLLLNWIMQWLHDRKQQVVIRDSFSSWIAVLSGVPQGSVL